MGKFYFGVILPVGDPDSAGLVSAGDAFLHFRGMVSI